MHRKHWTVVRALHTDPRVLQRFWKLVRRSDDASECWEWIGALTPNGYPSFHVVGRNIAASHVAWFTAVGELPEVGRVKRQCGNVLCVRPTHLAWALSSLLERAVKSLGDGYVELAGHAFTPEGRAPRDPRRLRAVVSATGTLPREAIQSPDHQTNEAADAA